MPVDKPYIKEAGVYFITFTNYNWLPLFDIANAYGEVYKWFDHLKLKGHNVLSYVIMPNHLHVIVAFSNTSQSINTIVGNGKRFIAYSIVRRLEAQGKTELLAQLAEGVNPADRRRGKLHEVFQPSFDIKRCDTFKFIYQKLDYIHNNPIAKKWNLAEYRYEYPHSSAKFYDKGMHSVYEVTGIEKIVDKWIEV